MKKKTLQKPEVISSTVPTLSDPTQVYLREISQFPVLSKEQEVELSKKFYETRDPQIAQILARSNLRFVVKVAAEYTRFGARLLDLIQEGNIGLLHAIKEFNPYRGTRLITYAVWWIKGYIQEYLLRQYSLVRIGTNAKQRKLFYLLKKEQERLAQIPYGERIQLLTHSGFKEKEVQDMRQRIKERDAPWESTMEKETPGLSTEKSSMEEHLSFSQEKTLLKESLKHLRPKLKTKELFVLENRLLCDKPMTLQEIGNKFSVSREAVRQTESNLIKKIKKELQARGAVT